jgi:cytochrome c-type biogenesis protein CcmH
VTARRRIARWLGVGLGVLLAAMTIDSGAAAAAAVAPRASLTDIEMQVMCVTCGVPLSVAESPQADHERDFIRGLIAKGETTAQIKQALVAQLGPLVLALPQDRGFNVAVYIVPVAVILLVGVMLAVAVRRWRKLGPDDEDDAPDDPAPGATALNADEAARLDDELARFPA